jgi:putative PIN family toxin of toxin-antitoxin system
MIWGGLPADIVKAAEDGRITIVVSEGILEEVNRTLAYQRLREIYEEAGVSREELLETVLRIGKIRDVETKLKVVQEDPSDNKFLECAVESGADYIVSGDEHLLRIKQYQKTQIVSVRQFIRILGELG